MIICWWSGGVTSAIACLEAISIYGKENCRIIFMDTKNEDGDTYRFMSDCEKLYGLKIETISAIPNTYSSIQECWEKHLSLNVASGAICSYKLKRVVREKWEKENKYSHQVFGFEFESKEFKRAKSMVLNHPQTNPVFPLLLKGYTKEDCIKILNDKGILIPRMYRLGFKNNNCFKTGCVQGGIGYWKKMQKDFPDKFNEMAQTEHRLTDLSGFPVTMLKDQSNSAKESTKINKFANLVFLEKHPKYSNKCIDDMEGREIEPIADCNGFCGIDELNQNNKTVNEINWSQNEH